MHVLTAPDVESFPRGQGETSATWATVSALAGTFPRGDHLSRTSFPARSGTSSRAGTAVARRRARVPRHISAPLAASCAASGSSLRSKAAHPPRRGEGYDPMVPPAQVGTSPARHQREDASMTTNSLRYDITPSPSSARRKDAFLVSVGRVADGRHIPCPGNRCSTQETQRWDGTSRPGEKDAHESTVGGTRPPPTARGRPSRIPAPPRVHAAHQSVVHERAISGTSPARGRDGVRSRTRRPSNPAHPPPGGDCRAHREG